MNVLLGALGYEPVKVHQGRTFSAPTSVTRCYYREASRDGHLTARRVQALRPQFISDSRTTSLHKSTKDCRAVETTDPLQASHEVAVGPVEQGKQLYHG